VKAFEASEAVKNGADELDYVINISALKDGDFNYLKREAVVIREAAPTKVIKAIIETSYLTKNEIEDVSSLLDGQQIDFVKTSTGFSPDGAKVEDLKLMKKSVKRAQLKASGGIRSLEKAEAMIKAGADRLGLSSSVALIDDLSKV
jgi:deoxyribose-phosphate aldolase